MKRIPFLGMLLFVATLLFSCQKEEEFIKKAPATSSTVNSENEGFYTGTPITPQKLAMHLFQFVNEKASEKGFTGAFPNFYEGRHGIYHVAGTIFLKSNAAEWRDVPLYELNNTSLDDFEERIRSVNSYATQRGFIGALPNFFHADYGRGIVCGTILINSTGAEWRDVPLSELGNPSLNDFGARFRATQDYAIRNGFVGGFPNFFHADYGNGIVCGTILLKKGFAEWQDVVTFKDPRLN